MNEKNIKYSEGVYLDKNWDEFETTYNEFCINNKNTAIKMATIILEGFQENEVFRNYVPQSVFYDTNDKIWVVSFWEGENTNSDGPDFNIAIKAENAQVVKMWCGE